MSKTANFLVEIQTEELPPKALLALSQAFSEAILKGLEKVQLTYSSAKSFATPRRLAVLVRDLKTQQADSEIERKGPAIVGAFNASGEPTPASLGFAKSCGVSVEELARIQKDGAEWLGFLQKVAGKSAEVLLPGIVQDALNTLPIPKRMRWGATDFNFVRPVHGLILLLGKNIIPAEILGVKSGRDTVGHRFHCEQALTIHDPEEYENTLETKGFVIPDFEKRKALIRLGAEKIVQEKLGGKARVLMDPDLLNEVTGLVEWPQSLLGDFDKSFLSVPGEALISAMQDHQRYFPIVDEQGKLLSHFVITSNIASKDQSAVIAGNALVIRARLADAAFFFETDKKQRLDSRLDILKEIIFQAKLGSLYDKAERLSKLSQFIAKQLQGNTKEENSSKEAERAGFLAKTDLTTEMVKEFPELQGIAGYYYALHHGESEIIAVALKEQYLPRFSGDVLPASQLGAILALADRIDILVSVFGLNQAPTGDKDPFGLRRAALGILRILIEKSLDLDLRQVMEFALSTFKLPLANPDLIEQVMQFMQERMKPLCQEQGIGPDVFAAVAALKITRPYDFYRRVQAVQSFKNLPDAESLSIANKRVSNILSKLEEKITATQINANLFEVDAERDLAKELEAQSQAIAELYRAAQYVDVLSQLSHLRQPVDVFFETVMVMAEDKAQRENRLLLLLKLRELFLQVADVALLQTTR